MSGLLILDFDGTMTDAEAEGAPFRTGYLEDIASLTGCSADEVVRLAEIFEAEIAKQPGQHGWIFNGHIVAPASVDPYLRIMPVARRILDHAGCFLDPNDRTRLLDSILYKYNYTKTAMVFREGASELLHGLGDRQVYVVTNSHTGAVQEKIRRLGMKDDGHCALDWLVARVYGGARKYVLDAEFDLVPERLMLPGLERPVLLRRRLYYEILDQLRQEVDVPWSDVTVVGDIFELDLALPLALGARVALMVNEFTPPWESSYLRTHERGMLLSSVSEIPGVMGW